MHEATDTDRSQSPPASILHRALGRISFDDAVALQDQAIDEYRSSRRGLPLLFSLEHSHVVTCGRSTDKTNLLLSPEEYQKRGIDLRYIDRGGDVTYHGPGQVVVYPIIALRDHKIRAGEYIRLLEDTMIGTCMDWGVDAFRRYGFPGCWTDSGKIGAVGAAIKSGGVTKHGLSFNVSTDLEYFKLIVPCGIDDHSTVRLSDLADRPVTLQEVETRLVKHFADLLGLKLISSA